MNENKKGSIVDISVKHYQNISNSLYGLRELRRIFSKISIRDNLVSHNSSMSDFSSLEQGKSLRKIKKKILLYNKEFFL